MNQTSGAESYSERSSLFVATENSLRTGGGGVQLCTADYLRLLRLAGFDLEIVAFATNQSWTAKLKRRLAGFAYRQQVPENLFTQISEAIRRTNAEYVFFNLLDFPAIAFGLRQTFGSRLKLIHLSHGLDSTDICLDEQSRRNLAGNNSFDKTGAMALGGKLQYEADYRRYLDFSLCISPLDAELERWLGVPRTAWFSRMVTEPLLPMLPIQGRVGCVLTLDHPPNRHGLLVLCKAIAQRDITGLSLRIVGGPEDLGRKLEKEYSFISYCGRLDDEDLRKEAATWSCFVHPLFQYARGCSTKLAVALGWGLPIATTVAGARGYVWDAAKIPLASTGEELSALVLERATGSGFEHFRQQTLALRESQPSAKTLAVAMKEFLTS